MPIASDDWSGRMLVGNSGEFVLLLTKIGDGYSYLYMPVDDDWVVEEAPWRTRDIEQAFLYWKWLDEE